MFRAVVTSVAIVLTAACSPGAKAPAATVTGPTAMTIDAVAGGGVSRPAIVNFPPRADAMDFRSQLESKYASMGRRPAEVFVDMEGEVAWVGEYDRYRTNGCDHNTATQYVMAQVDGQAANRVCSVLAFPETAIYPPRDQIVDFRRQLGAKYQGMGRSAQSTVDADGAAIWISEYLRYRTSSCDHPSAVQKTLTQVDGNPAPESCSQQCAYYISTPVLAGAAGGTLTSELIRTSGTCDWLAESEVPWILLNRPVTGTNRSRLSYTVEPNTGGSRAGSIRVNYPGGRSYIEVNQGSPSTTVGFQFFDLSTQQTATTECRLKVPSTACTLAAAVTASATPIVTYDWRVEYSYNGLKVKTQVSASPNFTFNDTCGPSAADGSPIPMSVTLKVTDTIGNTQIVYAGQGIQPALQLRSYTCQ